jgi:tight adherence protein B
MALPLIAIWASLAVAIFGLGGGVLLLVARPQRRIYSRVQRFVSLSDAPTVESETGARKNRREQLFQQLDARWKSAPGDAPLVLELSRADSHLTLAEFAVIRIGVALGLMLILMALAPSLWWLMAIIGLLVGWRLPRIYMRRRGRRRLKLIDKQMPDILNVIAGGMRSGSSFFQALDRMGRDAPEPSRTEYARVIRAVGLGSPLEIALRRMVERVPTEDMDVLITAITIQQQTGGDLAHILDLIATTVRERHRIQREIQALTSQQRFSAWLLTGLPIFIVLVLYLINPNYIGRIFQPSLILLIPITGAIMLIIGGFLMNKIAAINV